MALEGARSEVATRLDGEALSGAHTAIDASLLAMLAGCGAVVLMLLNKTPLWLDELQQFGGARHTTVRQLLDWVAINPGAAPLPYIVQKTVIDLVGFSTFTARLPAAICSIACCAVFTRLCRELDIRWPRVALILFFLYPLQFRYALEARVYSQGLLAALLAFWQFLRYLEKPTRLRAVLYGVAVAFGLYSQPFSLLPALGEVLWLLSTRRPAAVRVLFPFALSAAAFVPWWVLQQQRQALNGAPHFFAVAQIRPVVLIHELTGGGYFCAIALAILGCIGYLKGNVPKATRRLLLLSFTSAMVGPLLADALFDYFFAPRQLIYCAPSLILLSSIGLERLSAVSRGRALSAVCLATFILAAGFKDARIATVPKDDLVAGADAVAKLVRTGSCLITAPRNHLVYYGVVHPEVMRAACADTLTTEEAVAVFSEYSSPSDRNELTNVLRRYNLKRQVLLNRIEIRIYGLSQ